MQELNVLYDRLKDKFHANKMKMGAKNILLYIQSVRMQTRTPGTDQLKEKRKIHATYLNFISTMWHILLYTGISSVYPQAPLLRIENPVPCDPGS